MTGSAGVGIGKEAEDVPVVFSLLTGRAGNPNRAGARLVRFPLRGGGILSSMLLVDEKWGKTGCVDKSCCS